MRAKSSCKIAIDVFMTLGLLFLMGYPLWGDVAHEWAGAGTFLLFIAHHALNWKWYRNLCRGRYAPARILQASVDLLLLVAMIGLMISGAMLSNYAFAFLNIRGGLSFARLLHMAASYWGFVLMALHLGLHWSMFVGMARKALKVSGASPARRAALFALSAAIAVYGLATFFRRDLIAYMLVRTQFVFLDFGEPKLRFYLDYLAMMGAFVFFGHYLSGLLVKARRAGRAAK